MLRQTIVQNAPTGSSMVSTSGSPSALLRFFTLVGEVPLINKIHGLCCHAVDRELVHKHPMADDDQLSHWLRAFCCVPDDRRRLQSSVVYVFLGVWSCTQPKTWDHCSHPPLLAFLIGLLSRFGALFPFLLLIGPHSILLLCLSAIVVFFNERIVRRCGNLEAIAWTRCRY